MSKFRLSLSPYPSLLPRSPPTFIGAGIKARDGFKQYQTMLVYIRFFFTLCVEILNETYPTDRQSHRPTCPSYPPCVPQTSSTNVPSRWPPLIPLLLSSGKPHSKLLMRRESRQSHTTSGKVGQRGGACRADGRHQAAGVIGGVGARTPLWLPSTETSMSPSVPLSVCVFPEASLPGLKNDERTRLSHDCYGVKQVGFGLKG